MFGWAKIWCLTVDTYIRDAEAGSGRNGACSAAPFALLKFLALFPYKHAFSFSEVLDLTIWRCLACGYRINDVEGYAHCRTFKSTYIVALLLAIIHYRYTVV
jgi:hypothetical protein